MAAKSEMRADLRAASDTTAAHHHNEELFKGWFAATPWNAFIFARVADIYESRRPRRDPLI
jgi:hypothetical protein